MVGLGEYRMGVDFMGWFSPLPWPCGMAEVQGHSAMIRVNYLYKGYPTGDGDYHGLGQWLLNYHYVWHWDGTHHGMV